MEFLEMKRRLQESFKEMTKDVDKLFEIEIDKDEFWNLYLDSFPVGKNEIFRERREHDCGCCRHFIKTIGNAVVIDKNVVKTIWDVELNDDTYQPVFNALSSYLKAKEVSDVYISKDKNIGTNKNFEQLDNGKVLEWDHFYLELPNKFVDNSSKSVGDIQGTLRDTKNVFKRSLDEITEDSLLTILELISSNSLYKGEEWNGVLKEFLKYKKAYSKLTTDTERNNFAWEQSIKAGGAIGRIRNHSIGTLLINVSEGIDLDTAVKKYETIVAPTNYKRPKAIFTQKMLDEAKDTLKELGYMDSLNRRFATLDDITVNNILFSNKDSAKRISGSDIFDEMSKDVVINPKKFSKVEEISAKYFIKNVLPYAKEVDAFVENKHEKNFVSLIAPSNPDAKTMFKWNNGLSWAYTGNITDSDMKANVKAAGGNVDGVLRFSIQWNESGRDDSDLDAHCKEPNGDEVYFSTYKKPRVSSLGGQLDVDIINPCGKVAVENITYETKSRMKVGTYKFFVNPYSVRGSKGFKAEIEFNGEIYSFEYNNPVSRDVQVAEVTLNQDGEFTIKEKLSGNSTISTRNVWGVSTNQFVPVSVICYSPNYFDEQDEFGHRHMFLMLKDCINSESPNSFYNEYLKEDLMKHKRVFECLGAKCHVEEAEDQLSGIGFSMTKRADLIVKVTGQSERVLKIKF